MNPRHLFLGLLVTFCVTSTQPTLGQATRNVLFIAIDDLRSDLGIYGVAEARTPQIDAFAGTARAFTRHYVQVPTCGASRCALLRGRVPSSSAHLGNNAISRTHKAWGDANLPAWFQRHGYRTLALGKITHHPGGLTGKHWAEEPEELPGSWTRSWVPETPWGAPQHLMHGYANGVARKPGESPPLEAFDGTDHAYPDAYVADEAVRMLKELAGSDQPWFFAAGFFKPHLPFAAPKRWYDLHRDTVPPAPSNAAATKPAWPSTWHDSGELRGNYQRLPGDQETMDPATAQELRRAYAACVSYVDAQVGRVLTALQDLGLADTTVVVLWSDHGFLLGEHAVWGKHCLFEQALRSPLLIRHPGQPRPGVPSAAVVETVDIFPTLTDLCGLPMPAGLDGKSLRPQLTNPAAPSVKPARSWWNKGLRTVRDDRWRLVQGANGRQVELYDYAMDPEETRNHAAAQPDQVARLAALLGPALSEGADPRKKN